MPLRLHPSSLFLQGGPTAAGTGRSVDWTLRLALGGYVTAAEGHQLLTTWATGYDLGRGPPSAAWRHGLGLVGYNVMVRDKLELISQLGVAIPQSGEQTTGSAMLGLVATLQ
jgi:hypothetical protein